MLAALISLSIVCVLQMVFIAWFVRHTQDRNDRMRTDLMDRFMEGDIGKMKRAQATVLRAQNPAAIIEPQVDDDDAEEYIGMGARL